MRHVGRRKLAPAAQEERPRPVSGLRERGLTDGAITAQTGLTQTGVFHICQRFAGAGLHADLKQAVTGKPPARSRPELKRRLINHRRRLSMRPNRVRGFFHRPTARYAA